MSRWRKVKQGKNDGRSTKKRKEEKAESELACAPVTIRLKAFLTDTFMIVMPILYIVIYFVMGDREGFKAHMGEGWLIILIAHFIAVVAFWYFKKGQTPGMKAYELYLVDPQTGQKPGLLKLVLRYVMLQVAILTFFGMFIPFLLKNRAGLHDLVSGSCIVYKSDTKPE